MLTPRNKNLCVFGAWFGDKFLDNTKYLFLDFEKRGLDCVWITKNKTVLSDLTKKGHRVYMAYSLKGVVTQLRAKYFFICTGFADVSEELVGGATIINFWHGVPLKKIMRDNPKFGGKRLGYKLTSTILSFPRRNYYIISTSTVYDDIFMRAFGRDSNHILKCGYPRNDIFFHKDNVGILRSQYKNKTIVVYMPTHRDNGNTHIQCEKLFDLHALNCFCEDHNAVFIIKKHFYHRHETTDCSFENIIDITQEDIDPQQLLLSADILISDYSGAYIDYLLLDRPIIFYTYDYQKYTSEDRQLYFKYEDVTPGLKASCFDEVKEELGELLAGNDYWKDERKRVKDIFFRKEAQKPVSQLVYDFIKYDKSEYKEKGDKQ